MKRFLKVMLVGLVFGLLLGLVFLAQFGNALGIAFGLAAGLLSGVLCGAFLAYQASRFTRENPCGADEQLLHQGPANHFRKWEGVGGWLYLTDRRLLFRSHKLNLQNHEWSAPLQEIVRAETCRIAWIINGLCIETSSGREKFVVEDSLGWVEQIHQAKAM
ncbi:MAG TPA: hypothetical protein VNK04_04230 [Gemmataceae bacterium]|nr:hypothetical protein [Gemmataceae bacterium]